MRGVRYRWMLGAAALAGLLNAALAAVRASDTAATPGIVSHVKVLSNRVADVSSMEAWKRSFIKPGATDEQKALAVFRSTVAHRYQDAPPIELLHEGCVHDAIKTFNVYGYGMCCCASANIEALSRYVGLDARGWGIQAHSVPEVFYNGAWHMFDASLVNYFAKPDGQIASVAEIVDAVKGWLKDHPDYRGNGTKLVEFHKSGGWMGWKQGPELLTKCPFYDWSGWWPAKTHGWYSTMQEFDGGGNTPFVYEYGYSQGYQVNLQLRPGERIVRNWSHRGKHINGVGRHGDAPGCLHQPMGEGPMAYLRGYGDLTAQRIGSGMHEYDVPLAGGAFRGGALRAESVACTAEDNQKPALHAAAADKPGVVEFRFPSSYVYLAGTLQIDAVVAPGGTLDILFSDNNGLDWRPLKSMDRSGRRDIDLAERIVRHYDYRLRFVLKGKGTGLDQLRVEHAFQCSQRALPTLDKGDNTITFSAGPQEGTITIEGTSLGNAKGKNVELADFHPERTRVAAEHLRVQGEGAQVVFPIAAPGDIARLRFGGHYRARDRRDRWDVDVSLDGGKTFRPADRYEGPTQGKCRFTTFSEIPPGTRQALVRWRGVQYNTTCLFSLRIDADYREPSGGFRPVKITYAWAENGAAKQDVHIARSAGEIYTIRCAAKPQMKSIALELAD